MGLYPLNCPCCDKVFIDRKPFSKHKSSQKYKNNMLQKENYQLKLDLEIYKLKNNINITINNIDNSQNTINNNTFVFNTPERKNFSDVLGDIDMDKCLFTDTREGDKRFNPVIQIQKRVLNLIPSQRPVIIKGSKVICKNNDIEYIDDKAKAEIGRSIGKKMQQQVSLIDWDNPDDGIIFSLGLLQKSSDFLELFFHKNKENLTYKQTDK